MIQRIRTLSRYLTYGLLFSLSGVFYLLLAGIYYFVLFAPGQHTPDIHYFVIILGIFGAGYTFLTTLSIASHANLAQSYPFITRLPSRVEYLCAILLSSFLFSTIVQLILALLAWQLGGVELNWGQALEIPPLWLAVNLLMSVLALHATDFVTVGWSRAFLFGTILALLFAQSYTREMSIWLAGRFQVAASYTMTQGWFVATTQLQDMANWLNGDGVGVFDLAAGFLFWPFKVMMQAVVAGSFREMQPLAPGILLIYATVLFVLASDLFAGKDLYFYEL